MRLISFSATHVYGYLSFDIPFFEDLTFLTGLNGSGKTTALRLIVGLLTPALDILSDIQFDTASLGIRLNSGDTITIDAQRTEKDLSLRVTDVDKPCRVPLSTLAEALEVRRTEWFLRLDAAIRNHPVIEAIRALPSPMFLGLERRHTAHDRYPADAPASDDLRRRHPNADHRLMTGTSLGDVQELVRNAMARLNATQSAADNELRKQIILDAFAYRHGDTRALSAQVPQKDVVDAFKAKRQNIEQAAGNLGIPVDQVQAHLNEFFDRMDTVLERLVPPKSLTREQRKKRDAERQSATVEWIINKPQVDRIWSLFQLMEPYVVRRSQAQKPTENFLRLVNAFLLQTGKAVELDPLNYLVVAGAGSDRKPLTALSSGERQILVMLAHLSLNDRLADHGVFIVDEPELSLHMAWQEKFVSAVREASPETQLVLATHSPAIILEDEAHCVDITRRGAHAA